MASLSIRNLDDRVKERLRLRAAANGRSMEAEIRAILSDAVDDASVAVGLGQALLSRFSAIGGADVELPARSEAPRAAELSQ